MRSNQGTGAHCVQQSKVEIIINRVSGPVQPAQDTARPAAGASLPGVVPAQHRTGRAARTSDPEDTENPQHRALYRLHNFGALQSVCPYSAIRVLQGLARSHDQA